MKKGIHNSLPLILYAGLLICSIFVSGCNNAAGQREALQESIVDTLLQQADSLPKEALIKQLELLRPEQRMQFFNQRLFILEDSGRMDELAANLDLYQHYGNRKPEIDPAFSYFNAVYLQYKGLHDSADTQYLRAIQLCQQDKDSLLLSKCLDSRGGNLGMMGRIDDAIAIKYQALAICESIGEQLLAMYTQAFLANLYVRKQEYEKTIQLSEAPLKYFRTQGDQNAEAYILLTLANAYSSLEQLDTSITLHKQIQQIYNALGRPPNMNEHLYHYSRVLIKKGRWQEALDSLSVVKQRILASQDKQGLIFVDLAAADVLIRLNRQDEAAGILENCLRQAAERKLFSATVIATQLLSNIKRAQGDYQRALYLLNQHLSIKDSIFNQEKARLTRELSVKYETAQKEQQIASLQREVSLANQRNAWIAGTLAALMLGFLYILRMRFLRKQQQMRADKLIMEAKTETMQQQIEFQKAELATHQAQLQDYTQILISKNKQLAELSKQLEQPTTSPEASSTQEELEGLYNSVIHTDKDWELFQAYFNKVHPGFIAYLKQELPELSPAELRTILLDKMNLNLREHAEILGISIDAVKKSRYRLRKKYGISAEEDFSSLWR